MFHGKGMDILRRESSFLNEEVLLGEGKDGLGVKDEYSSEHKETTVRKCRESGSNKQLRLPGVRRLGSAPRCGDQICGRSRHTLSMSICGKCVQPS